MTNKNIIIETSQIIRKISVWLEDTKEPFSYDYKIGNILYSLIIIIKLEQYHFVIVIQANILDYIHHHPMYKF